jgi:hypothetical protein
VSGNHDRVALFGHRPTMVLVRISRDEDWTISPSYARLLGRELLRAADQAEESDKQPDPSPPGGSEE